MVFLQQQRTLQRMRVWLIALPVLAGVGYSAQAAIRAIIAHPIAAEGSASPLRGYEAEDHFPGAASFYATDAGHAAAPGSSDGADRLPADASIHPAPPFSMRAASVTDRARALSCLTDAIYFEAANEPDGGQRAVAQVILNRVRHPAFPATVCGVIYQGSDHAGCQFSYACDGSMARARNRALWLRAAGVAADALSGYVYAPVGMATHYHTYAVTPAWNRHMVMTAAIGAHFFHRWQGFWGTPQAFRQVYRGGEPEPGPHPRPSNPAGPGDQRTLAAFMMTAIPTSSLAADDYADNTARTLTPPAPGPANQPGDTAPGANAADSQILDKWKDSGKPLR